MNDRFKMLGTYIFLFVFVFTTLLIGKQTQAYAQQFSKSQNIKIEKMLRKEFNNWKHINKHCMKGKKGYGKICMDCSGFVKAVYKKLFKLNLPENVKGIAKTNRGYILNYQSRIQAGDLVIFQKSTNYPYHVGIYLSNNQFMHVSAKRGVIISRIDDGVWWSKYKWAGKNFRISENPKKWTFTARRIISGIK